MYLQELKYDASAGKPEFGPTPKFKRVYGHYCGPGNEGGEPIDAVDAACKCHDECYHYQGRFNPACDKKFIEDLNKLLKTKLTFKQRTAAIAMKLYFLSNSRKKIEAP